MIACRLQVNEWDGLVQATQAHNQALTQRVGDLAKRVEDLTFQNRSVERLKDEFYQLCKDYIDKKKIMVENNMQIHDKLERAGLVKEDLLS